jgi:hypothetical protein
VPGPVYYKKSRQIIMDTSGLSNRLTNYGIHVDDLSRLRVLDEAAGNHAHDLRQDLINIGLLLTYDVHL